MKEIEQGQQIAAALSYASMAHRQITFPEKEPIIPDFWPWDKESWKVHSDPRDNLEEARAFISDELIRLKYQPAPDTKIIITDKSNIIPFK